MEGSNLGMTSLENVLINSLLVALTAKSLLFLCCSMDNFNAVVRIRVFVDQPAADTDSDPDPVSAIGTIGALAPSLDNSDTVAVTVLTESSTPASVAMCSMRSLLFLIPLMTSAVGRDSKRLLHSPTSLLRLHDKFEILIPSVEVGLIVSRPPSLSLFSTE